MDTKRIEQVQRAGLWRSKPAHVKQVDENEHTLWIDVLRLSVDRDGEVVLPKSPLKHLDSYLANPIVLHGHNYHEPAVAKMVDYHVDDERFTAKDEFAVDEYDLAATLFKLYAGGFMSACSVGFIPRVMSRKKVLKEQSGVTYTEIEMLEHSLVTVPSNRESLRRNYKQFEKWDPRFKDNIDHLIESPTNYDCGHLIIMDAEGSFPVECPTCAEKGMLAEISLPRYDDSSGKLVSVIGRTDAVNDHYHLFDFILDEQGSVAGRTRGTRSDLDAEEFSPMDFYSRPESHTHLINDPRGTLEAESHVHGMSIQMDALHAAGFTSKTVDEIKNDLDVLLVQRRDEVRLIDSDSSMGSPAVVSVCASNGDGEIYWIKLPSQDSQASQQQNAFPSPDDSTPPPSDPADPSVKRVSRFADLPLAPEGTSWHFNVSDSNAVLGDPPDWKRYRRAHVWYDPDNAETKSGYKLPIARMFDGTLKVVWRGVAAAMGALLGARGGVDIPDGERKSVYNHLAKYYRKFDKEPPEFREYLPDEIKLFDLGESPLIDSEPEIKTGRVLSQRNFERIQTAVDSLQKALDECSHQEPDDKDAEIQDDSSSDEDNEIDAKARTGVDDALQRSLASLRENVPQANSLDDDAWRQLCKSIDRLKSIERLGWQ